MLFSRLPRMFENFGERDRDPPAPVELREDDLQRLKDLVRDVEPEDDEFVDPDLDPRDPRRARERPENDDKN